MFGNKCEKKWNQRKIWKTHSEEEGGYDFTTRNEILKKIPTRNSEEKFK